MNRWKVPALGFVMALVMSVCPVHAQEEGPEEPVALPAEVEERAAGTVPAGASGDEIMAAPEDEALDALLLDEEMTMFELIMKGGVVGGLIILLSCVALGLVIDYAMTIRRARLAPVEDIAEFRDLVAKKDFTRVREAAQARPTFLSHVVTAGLEEVNLGYQAMVKAMEDTAEALTAKQARRIEHLNVIGNISPMMGLLGTVIGMLRCFNEISQVSGSIDPKLLAAGIFEALVTTCLGLIVAIPTLYFYAIFRNRLDELAGEASVAAEQILSTFKSDAAPKGT